MQLSKSRFSLSSLSSNNDKSLGEFLKRIVISSVVTEFTDKMTCTSSPCADTVSIKLSIATISYLYEPIIATTIPDQKCKGIHGQAMALDLGEVIYPIPNDKAANGIIIPQ